jgi:hypothetical protein
VSLYQAAILLLFNGADELPFGDIKTATRMGACRGRSFGAGADGAAQRTASCG